MLIKSLSSSSMPPKATTSTPAATPSPQGQKYFAFREYLSNEQREAFFDLPHREQIQLVREYVTYLEANMPMPMPVAGDVEEQAHKATAEYKLSDAAQLRAMPPAPSFPAAAGASTLTSPAHTHTPTQDSDPLQSLALLFHNTRTLSGFGVHGSPSPYLPQRHLSFRVAECCEEIGHKYVVEGRPGQRPVLNSRSFFNYWCHAEKQLLVYLYDTVFETVAMHTVAMPSTTATATTKTRILPTTLATTTTPHSNSNEAATSILSVLGCIHVSRPLCPDCMAFFTQFAKAKRVSIRVCDPQTERLFSYDV